MRAALVLTLLAATAVPAVADRYIMQRGETLEHVARAKGCSVDTLMRVNNVKTTLIKAGTAISVPDCSLHTRARTRTIGSASKRTDVDKARAALEVVDGATWIDRTLDRTSEASGDAGDDASEGEGKPWHGKLEGAERLPGDDGYQIRRPSRAYGVPYVVDHLRSAIAVVRALYPDVHTLAIGDLSAEHGGKLDNHRSHQTGLDVDVGFYFRKVPDGYPDRFADADANLDLEATWALLTAFARTTSVDDGVEIIFLDHAVQKRLYDWARKRHTPEADLEQLLQYPRSKDTQVGLVRHWPNHEDHMHVRFRKKAN